MVFMWEPPSGPCGGYASAAFRWEDPTLGAYCPNVASLTYWYHLYRFTLRKVHRDRGETADFVVRNRPNDTDDTKPSSCDTPTIPGITTMTRAGVLDVAYVAEIAAVT